MITAFLDIVLLLLVMKICVNFGKMATVLVQFVHSNTHQQTGTSKLNFDTQTCAYSIHVYMYNVYYMYTVHVHCAHVHVE